MGAAADSDEAAAGGGAEFRTHEVRGWRRVVLWPFGILLALWGRTWRFEVEAADKARITKRDEPVAIVLWHNRLLLSPQVFRRYRGKPLFALVSASRDGAWLAAFFRTVGVRTVRGSSSRGAREAVGALTAVLKAGHDIGITPDGPRGPRYDLKPGGVIVARRARATVLLLGLECAAAWRFRSWDGLYLPWPFARVRVRCIEVSAVELMGDRAAVVAAVARKLTSINADHVAARSRS